MVSFEQFTREDGIPVYLQIVQHIKREMVAGKIEDQDEMPSRRVLSSLLAINPNTVQKAYRILEEEHLIESRSGAKSYVTVCSDQIKEIRIQLLETQAAVLVDAMKQMGLSKAEGIKWIEEQWEKSEGQ